MATTDGVHVKVVPAMVPPSAADTVVAEIQSAAAQVKAVAEDINGLVLQIQAVAEELRSLQAAKPRDPGPKATAAQKAAHQKALNAWQGQVSALQTRLAGLQSQLAQKKKDLDVKTAHLQMIESTKLPQARARDRAELERQVEQAKKAAEGARESMSRLERTGEASEDELLARKKAANGLKAPPPVGIGFGPGVP